MDDLNFKSIIQIPDLPLSRGNIKGIEIHSNDPRTTISFITSVVQGFLLSRATQMETGPQGFVLPGVGSIKWKKLVLPNDSPVNNTQDINEMIHAICAIIP